MTSCTKGLGIRVYLRDRVLQSGYLFDIINELLLDKFENNIRGHSLMMSHT